MTDNVFAPPRAELEARTGPDELWDMEYKQVRRLAIASINIRTLGVLVMITGVLSLLASYSAFARPSWGRFLGIVLCLLGALNVPIGMLIGIVGLVSYVQGRRLFGPDKLPHKDVTAVTSARC